MIFPPCQGYCSPTYRAISKGSHYILDGFEFRIGNGKCSFWFTPWLKKVSIASRIPFVHIADSRLRVVDVFSNGIWDTNHLYSVIDEDIRQDLLKFGPLLVHNSCKDRLCWAGSKKGKYSFKEGYRWIVARNENPQPGSSWIWSLPCPEKVPFLIWLILHDSLPTNSIRFHWRMAENPLCSIYGVEEEHWHHVIFFCPWAAVLWRSHGLDPDRFSHSLEWSNKASITKLFKSASAMDLAFL